MNPESIQVGKFYLNTDWPNSRWLGAGKRKPWTYAPNAKYTETHLVCVKNDPAYPEQLGLIFKTPEDEEGANIEDWECFYLDSNQ